MPEPGRDEFEIDLARRAMAADLPLLAICRGAPVLNVAAGGTLVRDVPLGGHPRRSCTASSSRRAPKPTPFRWRPESRLERALGAVVDGAHTLPRVNSRHHQSVGRVGSGLVSSATAPDGVVEAIEKPNGEFCVGVQWHPENFWLSGEFAPLFATFVSAARERLSARSGSAS